MLGFWKMIPMLRRTRGRLAIEVVAGDRDRAARLGQGRGQDRDRGRLAGAVRTEEGEQLAGATPKLMSSTAGVVDFL